MKKKRNRRSILLLLSVILLALCLLPGCGKKDAETIASIEQLKGSGRKIGVPADTADGRLVAELFPQAEIEYYKDEISGYTSVSQGKLDAFVYSRLAMSTAIYNGMTGVRLLDESVGEGYTCAVGLSPRTAIPDLEEKINAFLGELKADGTMDEMIGRWFERHEETMPVISLPKTSPLHLTVGTTGSSMPFTYYIGTELSGYDVELAYRFAAWLGSTLEFKVYDYGGIVAAAQGGDIDCIFAGLFVTPERAEALAFSQPTYIDEIAVMVRGDGASAARNENASAQGGGFWQRVAASFEKTFLREDRWKLFVSGIGTTLLITVLSIVLGTALGFGMYLLCRGGNPVANGLARFFVWLVQGMPVVVLLLILYYVVFGKVAISGTIVAIIGFTLVFGAAVLEMLKSGVGAVDKGQTEAAYALGYSDRRAFFRVVLPQALPHFFPAYKGEITAIIKATAIVGYVAVQDLTKMGDIVRSRTYEAFFPLIAVAVIYFILAGLLTAVVNRLGARIDPRRRKAEDVLKGVSGT